MEYTDLLSTYSIVAYDEGSDCFGVAVQTHQISVGRMVPFVLPGIGAVATQSLVNISYGPIALKLLEERISADYVIKALVASDADYQRRQVAVIDSQGQAAAFTGDGCIPHAGHHVGHGYSVQANMMTHDTVVDAMAEAYENSNAHFPQRLMDTLFAAQKEDGDIRGQQSAALFVVKNDRNVVSWEKDYDLRIDESDTPLDDLQRLVNWRYASFLSREGTDLLEKGDVEGALQRWRDAREIAPDDEELAFWQGITLADKNPQRDAVSVASRIIKQGIRSDERYEHWVDLILRLETVGIIERAGAGQELLVELKDN